MEASKERIIAQLELETQEYSVFITDEKRTSSGSGVLFYPGSGSNLYIFTCAHVLDNLEEPFQIYSLLPLNREQELYRVEKLEAMREQVKYSPIDKVSESAGGVIEHSIDAAVICLEIKKEISLETTDYVIGEARKGDGVLAQGFPGSETEIEELLNYVEGTYGRILHNANDKEVLLWQIEDAHVDSGNRVYELNGFSGSPVWSLEANEKTIVGLFTSGVGRSVYRGKVHALKMEAIRSIMKIFFQIRMESRILGIPNEEIAPQKDNPTYISNEAQPEIRDFYDEWLVAQTEKVRAYIDDVKFQNAINTAKMAIKDQRFEKCSKKIACTHIKHLLYCYEACLLDDEYEALEQEMQKRGFLDGHDPLRWITFNFGKKQFKEIIAFLVRALLFNLYRWGKYLFGWNTIFNMERHLEYIRKNGKEEMVITFENFIYECSHEPEEAEERYINSWKKNPCFELWKEILQFYKRNSMLDKADAMFETLFTEHTEYVESEPEYAFRAYISYILDYRRDLKKALHFYMIHKDEMKDEIVRELWESELMMCTNSFNNPDEFVEMRSVLVEQGLMSENEFHRISLVAYMCNLDSENAWKYFSKENPLFGKFDKAENEGVFLTNEGARFLVWQKKYPPHMEREWRGINIQGANAAKSLFEQEEWHLSPKSIANKLQYEIHKSIAIDTWGLYLLAVEEKLDLLERFDQIYVTHFSVSRMLEEITHFKNENMEVILAYLESAEHVKLQSPNFEVQLKVRENVNYYEPCSTIAMAVEAEIPAIIGETMLAQNLIDRFKNYIVRPDELEEMMGIACNSCFVREYQNNKG